MPIPDIKIVVHAGPHDRTACPLRIQLPDALPEDDWEVVGDDDLVRPLQSLGAREFAFIETGLAAGQSRTYALRSRNPDSEHGAISDERSRNLTAHRARAREAGMPFADVSQYRPTQAVLNRLPEETANRLQALPLALREEGLLLAVAYTQNTSALDEVRLLCRLPLQIVLCVPEDLEEAIRSCYAMQIVEVAHERGSQIVIKHAGKLLTRYVYGNVSARPYFYPVLSPAGIPITRSYPMEDIPGDTRDHPHHRSLWIAHGAVNGTDNWSEEQGHGFTELTSIDSVESGEVCGRFTTTAVWTKPNKTPLLKENLAVTTWAAGDAVRLLDFDVTLTADYEDVLFGDTKEGGILSARVASGIEVDHGGTIENTFGGINEKETWGKAAHWCHYSGNLPEGEIGMAIMDHPDSFRYPTYWHVRNYGLMTANPFGMFAYTGGQKNGDHVLRKGESLQFRYRVVLHNGEAATGPIKGHYLNFVSPPAVEVSPR